MKFVALAIALLLSLIATANTDLPYCSHVSLQNRHYAPIGFACKNDEGRVWRKVGVRPELQAALGLAAWLSPDGTYVGTKWETGRTHHNVIRYEKSSDQKEDVENPIEVACGSENATTRLPTVDEFDKLLKQGFAYTLPASGKVFWTSSIAYGHDSHAATINVAHELNYCQPTCRTSGGSSIHERGSGGGLTTLCIAGPKPVIKKYDLPDCRSLEADELTSAPAGFKCKVVRQRALNSSEDLWVKVAVPKNSQSVMGKTAWKAPNGLIIGTKKNRVRDHYDAISFKLGENGDEDFDSPEEYACKVSNPNVHLPSAIEIVKLERSIGDYSLDDAVLRSAFWTSTVFRNDKSKAYFYDRYLYERPRNLRDYEIRDRRQFNAFCVTTKL